jgi:splicing factor 3B subunit 3
MTHIDYIVLGSDSGRIAILEYLPDTNTFVQVHMETFGKSGNRRVVPGQYLAVDPKGRACMIAAVEKQKMVYVLNRDASARLTISSPLEAHKSHTLLYSVVALDVGFENPIFACLEVTYEDEDDVDQMEDYPEKMLTYYELDLGLNHVLRKWTTRVDLTANLLLALPGGNDGPSGVLVCSENFITYKHHGHTDIRVPIPKRENPLADPRRTTIINTAVVHKMKNLFFVLAQNDEGDVFKITMDVEEGAGKQLRIKYFDTIPLAVSLCLLKAGILFVAAECGDHPVYQFINFGDDDNEIEYKSGDLTDTVVHFKPRELVNLEQVDTMDNTTPVIDSKVMELMGDDSPQIYSICGRGARSAFRTLRHGIQALQVGASELPGYPKSIWTLRLHAHGKAICMSIEGCRRTRCVHCRVLYQRHPRPIYWRGH